MWPQLFLILAVILFVYPFILYPKLLALLVPSRQKIPIPLPGQDLPELAMVICALNEQAVIREKLENCLALEYPKDKLRIVLVSDGSTDATASIAREYTSRGLQFIERQRRRGKVSNLNEVLSSLQEEIVVLSDANVIYDSTALLHLVRCFEDPSVGCVSGKVILVDTTEELKTSEESYYSLEWKLQELASALYSMVGADGAMYALRRNLFRPCPGDTLIEDFVIPMSIVRQGRRVVFQPRAIARESGVTSLKEEFRRKVRIAAGAAQALVRGNGWPGRAPLRFWFIFLSHKLLRWISPLTGLLVLALALATRDQILSMLVLAGFLALIAAALLRVVTGSRHPLLNAPFYFLFGQVALLWGFLKGLTGRQSVLWAKANR